MAVLYNAADEAYCTLQRCIDKMQTSCTVFIEGPKHAMRCCMQMGFLGVTLCCQHCGSHEHAAQARALKLRC